jgi:multiple sugar transport system substrate-binding protein
MIHNQRSISRRGFLAGGAGVAGLGLVAALTGCSDSRKGNTDQQQSLGNSEEFSSAKIDWQQYKGTTITVSAEQHPWYAAIAPLLPKFTALTGIKVTPSVLGEDQYVSKVAVQLSGGSSSPDVFMINQFGQATGSNWLEPLDGYLGNSKLTDPNWYADDDFFRGAISFSTANGKRMALPITSEVQMLFLRSDLISQPPTTMDELMAAAQAANKGDVAGFGSRAVAAANQTPWAYGGFAFTEGGYFIDPSGQPALDSAENVKALQVYADLLSKYGPKGVSSWGFLENEQAMQQGRLAMWTDSSTFLGDLKDKTKSKAADSIAAYPFPSQNGKSVPNLWYWTIGMNAKSQNKEAAWLFMQWATSKPISQAAGLVGASPARASSWQTADAAAKIGKDNSDRILQSLKNADSKPMALAWQNTKWAQASDGLARAVNAAVTGSSPSEQLKTAQSQAKAIFG